MFNSPAPSPIVVASAFRKYTILHVEVIELIIDILFAPMFAKIVAPVRGHSFGVRNGADGERTFRYAIRRFIRTRMMISIIMPVILATACARARARVVVPFSLVIRYTRPRAGTHVRRIQNASDARGWHPMSDAAHDRRR